ncbi:MAG: HNH endonuclease family protein [Nitrososphaeraceae archaeon]
MVRVNFTDLSIEHIMPQKSNNWWKNHLGNKFESIHEIYLHNIGNLTLTGYNSDMSNYDFPRKKEILASVIGMFYSFPDICLAMSFIFEKASLSSKLFVPFIASK